MSKKISLFFIVIIALLTHKTQAQYNGYYFCKNYKTSEIQGGSQNWAVVRDNRGVMYFGTSDGILEYDGFSWRKIQVKNKSAVRSLAVDSAGTIYVGCVNEFGYLSADKYGNHIFISLADKLNKDERKNISEVFKTYVTPTGIYFASYNGIARYQPGQKDLFKIWVPKDVFTLAFYINNTLYTTEKNLGLIALQNDEFVKVKGGEQFGKSLYFMLPYPNNQILLGSRSLGIYIYNPNATDNDNIFRKLKTGLDDLFAEVLYCGVKLQNNRYFIGAIKKGCAIIDTSGKILQHFNKANGLIDNSIYNILETENDIVWLCTNGGLSKIDISQKFIRWTEQTGLEGTVNTFLINNNIPIIGTSIGLYYMDTTRTAGKISTFKPIEGINSQVWSLLNFKYPPNKGNNLSALLIGSSEGIYEYNNNVLKKIIDIPTVLELIPSADSSLVFVGQNNGFSGIKYENGKWIHLGSLPDFKAQVRSVIQDTQNNLWLGTRISFIYKLTPLQKNNLATIFTKNEYKLEHYDTLSGLPFTKNSWVHLINNNIIATTEMGLYIFNSNKNTFEPDTVLGKYYTAKYPMAYRIKTSNNATICINGRVLVHKTEPNKYIGDTVSLKRLVFGTYQSLYADAENCFWVTSVEGVARINPSINKNYNIKYNALIRKIVLNNDSVLFAGQFFAQENDRIILTDTQTTASIPVIDYRHNSVKFEFAATFFDEESFNKYSFYLKGFNSDWSAWQSETQKEYTNLHEGDYVFYLKAKNIYGTESTITSYRFTVSAPWYRTVLAYVIYILLAAVLVYIIVYLNMRRLKAANLHLESLVKERTREIRAKNTKLQEQNDEIMQQKEEIQSQAEELHALNDSLVEQAEKLEQYSKELEKLSIVASETDNAVFIMDNEGNFLWVNQGFTKMYGYTAEEFINKSPNVFEASSNSDIKNTIELCLQTKKSATYESEMISQNGLPVYSQTTITPIIGKNGQVEKLIAIDSNITKLKDAETEIKAQNEVINLKNEQITASIRYAQTIQRAMLPYKPDIDKYFENFIIFRPKDIVSGDFYWHTVIENIKISAGVEQLPMRIHFFAVVDCTGHGVPGAFMSLISSRLLNEIINEHKIYETDKIVNNIDLAIIKALQQEQTDNNDGMDLSLIRIDCYEKYCKVYFTGAKNPVYCIKSETGELLKMTAERRSIGGKKDGSKKILFTSTEYTLHKNDILYLLTDGYIDQNNSERKRLGTANFLQLLGSIYTLSIENQKTAIENQLNTWMQYEDQRDDITVMGIKL